MADDSAANEASKKQKQLLDEQTAFYNKQKAAADAQAAAIAAQVAAQKAAIGTVSGSGLTGAVTVGTGAGNAEATLLAAKATADAAQQIANEVKNKAKGTAKFLVAAGTQKLSLGHWRAFKIQLDIVQDAFQRAEYARDSANRALKKIEQPPTLNLVGAGTESISAIAGIGTALDLAAKLGSYFQSDYQAAGAAVTGVDDDLLAASVTGKLLVAENQCEVYFPARWLTSGSDTKDPFFDLLRPLAIARDAAPNSVRDDQVASQRLKDEESQATDARRKSQLANVAAAFDRAVDAYTVALKDYDALVASLGTPDKNGVPAAVLIADEKRISDLANEDNTYILFLKVNSAIGANYTRENLWTFFGCIPFYVMGGVVASYTLVAGKTGQVKASGQVQLHGGYRSVDDVESEFKKTDPRRETPQLSSRPCDKCTTNQSAPAVGASGSAPEPADATASENSN